MDTADFRQGIPTVKIFHIVNGGKKLMVCTETTALRVFEIVSVGGKLMAATSDFNTNFGLGRSPRLAVIGPGPCFSGRFGIALFRTCCM